jgi:hypothetical protein
MSYKIKLFVIDTGPLITLAVANSLHYLLDVQADIMIPDAMQYRQLTTPPSSAPKTSLIG